MNFDFQYPWFMLNGPTRVHVQHRHLMAVIPCSGRRLPMQTNCGSPALGTENRICLLCAAYQVGLRRLIEERHRSSGSDLVSQARTIQAYRVGIVMLVACPNRPQVEEHLNVKRYPVDTHRSAFLRLTVCHK
ncbi:hypothetical protein C8Q78DRAFT_445008 [Trametes maxima]|nr:hypothetical protein C8Q78DRAFT_445008 [Trametes maxima]